MVPWSLRATLEFIHDVFGPEFSEFIRHENYKVALPRRFDLFAFFIYPFGITVRLF